ncbi:bifunctional phosphopantothenoylcysteine decarboxylase/phosphopantothenate--cysteine ligase CoaBC [Evansella sp. AB-P1]|uniref:bifunctional phosphopantothenoylcysteine decarboxylase/phosphopantothenate--cysteine ligase CoaBC n=1 Tax=Evansella sp. AB-P1 TaxID=3037653 RepID=UPI00241FD8A3|nr:bifunctional phosphopantothenoylcysteine decarboxylase/phosphopantothenate--cysteine ligase CoaBC [Evansella sp. AB-P1]MDG5788248.1 bifunctional phosphopantothenoylcysteine decarboxylase/phosphopantothenate--cysteine ligase CoaBC [Evansella sp. AB-P1]
MENRKNILLCVSGGIAVFKAAALTSKLVQAGYNVKVVMTESATEFVTPLTFQALSRDRVYTNTFEEKDPSKVAHIDVADWADLVVIAPATANVIGKVANGIADDMLTTILLAATAPVLIAPAMNVHMYDHPAVKKNMETLQEYGYELIEPDEGYLACGYTGKGRMAEPEELLKKIKQFFIKQSHPHWHGKKLLITAGPTREKIDPVRFFTNLSSGKMGFAIAEEAAARGANVTLIAGPTSLTPPGDVSFIQVESAEEMYQEVMKQFDEANIVIKAAAVADYRPINVYNQKIKKQEADWNVQMERTKDILKTLGEKRTHQTLIGFAAESENIEHYAKKKLKSKAVDMIAANSITTPGTGFQGDTNEITLYKKTGEVIHIPLTTKIDASKEILDVTMDIFMENI